MHKARPARLSATAVSSPTNEATFTGNLINNFRASSKDAASKSTCGPNVPKNASMGALTSLASSSSEPDAKGSLFDSSFTKVVSDLMTLPSPLR